MSAVPSKYTGNNKVTEGSSSIRLTADTNNFSIAQKIKKIKNNRVNVFRMKILLMKLLLQSIQFDQNFFFKISIK